MSRSPTARATRTCTRSVARASRWPRARLPRSRWDSHALGLARADARRDDLTLASLGASPRLARAVAAWQGGILVAFAVGIGMAGAVALDVIGAMSMAAPGPFAWGTLAIALVVPPLVVAGLAWLMTRAPQPVHYRLAA